jgi:2-polyprenyl-6-hydroxyphenyl methylase/3-demethylubiquinone-9 3-methyltransferase
MPHVAADPSAGDPAADPVVDAATMDVLTRTEADIAFRRRVRTILGWIPPRDGALVLDVPCGRGFHLHRYHHVQPRCRIVGVELDGAIARRAREAVGPLGVPVLRGAIEALPFRDGCFDAAICSEVLEHLDDDVAGLRDVVRVVRPGGRIAITVPHADYPFWWDPVNRTLERWTGRHVRRGPLAGIWAGHRRLYTMEQLRETVRRAGLDVVEERSFTHHCLPFSHDLIYGLGKPLLERGLVPARFAVDADRHAFDRSTGRAWNPVALAVRAAGWFDRRNRETEPSGRTTVNLALLARRPIA